MHSEIRTDLKGIRNKDKLKFVNMNLSLKKRLYLYFITSSIFSFLFKCCLDNSDDETKKLILFLKKGKEKLNNDFNLKYMISKIKKLTH